MSVIVKGMEMPITCCNCKFREPFMDLAYCHLAEMDMEYEESDNCRHPDCPLVEIPTPPDDLVSREWIRDSINHSCWLEHNDYLEAVGIVDDAPNVIEAEGREE